jgi:hypothetical protein
VLAERLLYNVSSVIRFDQTVLNKFLITRRRRGPQCQIRHYVVDGLPVRAFAVDAGQQGVVDGGPGAAGAGRGGGGVLVEAHLVRALLVGRTPLPLQRIHVPNSMHACLVHLELALLLGLELAAIETATLDRLSCLVVVPHFLRLRILLILVLRLLLILILILLLLPTPIRLNDSLRRPRSAPPKHRAFHAAVVAPVRGRPQGPAASVVCGGTLLTLQGTGRASCIQHGERADQAEAGAEVR